MRYENIPNCVWHNLSYLHCVFDEIMWVTLVAYVLPKCQFNSVLVNFRHANSICPIFREGHAEFLYEFDPCTHIYVSKIFATRVGDHEGQWKEGGKILAIRCG